MAKRQGQSSADAAPPAPGGSFAVIEMGGHLARIQISQVTPAGSWETLEGMTRTVPFGYGIYRQGAIPATDIRLAGEIARDFSRLLRDYGAVTCKAVINGALREASNRDIFLERLKEISGIAFECLEEPEEIRLTYLAARQVLRGRYAPGLRNALMCMIGPDVSQVLFLEKGHLIATETIRLGTLRLKEELGGGLRASRLRELLDPFVGAVLNSVARLSRLEEAAEPVRFIALGATVRALADLGAAGRRSRPVAVLTREELASRRRQIAGITPAQLAARHQLHDVIAEGLDPCCIMLEHFFEITEADRLIIPMISTRDALLRDLWRESVGGEDLFLPEIRHAADHLALKFGCDATHSQAVTHLALRLFDELRPLHCLGARDRLLLELGGRLHDAGFFVSSRQHHKHSYYLVRNSELPGISPREQELVALICRYHRRASPRSSHPEFMALPPADRVRVAKLAALLRLADALDRSHRQQVGELRLELEADRLSLHVAAAGDLTLERQGLARKSDLFTELYGLKVVLGNG
ncbi:MAG: HD domain-containing protein [Lentisphaeria bacterium]|jgi:exopolyphosphatase/guanosine-5'-triphosphate,3'-diphosphate pyrophosphatase